MPKAVWNGKTLADSEATIIVDGNHYFPVESVQREFFHESPTKTNCHWKGTASYYHIKVDGQTNADAAWYYADPKAEANNIKDHVAFWKGVEVK